MRRKKRNANAIEPNFHDERQRVMLAILLALEEEELKQYPAFVRVIPIHFLKVAGRSLEEYDAAAFEKAFRIEAAIRKRLPKRIRKNDEAIC